MKSYQFTQLNGYRILIFDIATIAEVTTKKGNKACVVTVKSGEKVFVKELYEEILKVIYPSS